MRLLATLILVLALAFCASCERRAVAADDGKLKIVATVGMVGDIVRNVAGEHAHVTTLLGAGVDPHLYKPTRDDVVQLIRADIVFYNGLMLEGKMIDVLDKVGRRKKTIAVTQQIDPAYVLNAEGHADPHVWMDVSAWINATSAVVAALEQFDPANAAAYQSNGAAYIQQLKALNAYGKQVIASIPPRGRSLISSHDAFNYFGRAYGIEVMGVQGLSTESEAGLRRINHLVSLITSNQVKAVFVESSVPRKSIEALIAGVHSRGGSVAIGGELLTDAMGPAGTYEGTYIGMMDHNLTTVARALGGTAPEGGMQGKLGQKRH